MNIKKIAKKVKQKRDNIFFKKLGRIVDYYWEKWVEIRATGYDVRIKNIDEFKKSFSSINYSSESKAIFMKKEENSFNLDKGVVIERIINTGGLGEVYFYDLKEHKLLLSPIDASKLLGSIDINLKFKNGVKVITLGGAMITVIYKYERAYM